MTDPFKAQAAELMAEAGRRVSPDDVPAGWAVWEDLVHLWHGLYRPKLSMAEMKAEFNPRICLATKAEVLAEITYREHLRQLADPA